MSWGPSSAKSLSRELAANQSQPLLCYSYRITDIKILFGPAKLRQVSQFCFDSDKTDKLPKTAPSRAG
ncbi:hypothetical protein AAE478_009727 [Parahypoxylon ruwenzoriense]